jgi:hypothetical protein
MISLTEPIDFKAASGYFEAKDILPTPLGNAALRARADSDLLARSFFSSRVTDIELLQSFKDSVSAGLNGSTDEATQRVAMVKAAEKFEARGLLTNARLMLILRTNTALARGFGQWQEGNDPDILLAYPAQELTRHGRRKVPRKWREIWDAARANLGQLTTATPSGSGRLIALKNDPMWMAISDFGVPWPPFKYNSGMGVDDVDYETSIELGLITPAGLPLRKELAAPTRTAPNKPPPLRMNSGLKASASGMDADFIGALTSTFSGLSLIGAELVFSGDDDRVSNRTPAEVMEALCS